MIFQYHSITFHSETLLGLFENIAYPGSSHTNEELNELGGGGLDERNASFTSIDIHTVSGGLGMLML